MPAIGSDKWDTEVFNTSLDGVNSSVEADLILPTQQAWMLNSVIRGGKPRTRPPMRSLGYLPEGLIQGASYFSIQDGMIVIAVEGYLYRLRIGPRTMTVEALDSPQNSSRLKQWWFAETVGSLVVQDGQSDPIVYDGSTATRSTTVPRGTMMAYGNGRLWVAVDGNQVVAGNIVTDEFQSELQFTETNYLAGGGTLRFPANITGMAFSPAMSSMNQSDKGPLIVFGQNFAKSIRADITARDLWAQIPTFVGNVLDNVGAAGQNCITPVNQDLFWRDSLGGIRSLSSALVDQSGSGSSPLSREVAELRDFETAARLAFSSTTYFDNRLLVLASPFINPNGGTSFKDTISLDFAPISTMRGKSPPAYDGSWSGAQFTQLITGKIDGRERCFGISSDSDGNNRLWEIERTAHGVADHSEVGDSPIRAYLETSQRNFGTPKKRKKLARCDVYIDSIEKEVSLRAWWRPDNQQKWIEWELETSEACALMQDVDVTTVPHVWKNLLPQYRPQIKTFTPPEDITDVTKRPMSLGFEFQLRLSWTGKLRVTRILLHALPGTDQQWADTDILPSGCIYNDVTGNSIFYSIPIRVQPGRFLTTEDGVDLETEAGLLLGVG